jgi:hypothetical protein
MANVARIVEPAAHIPMQAVVRPANPSIRLNILKYHRPPKSPCSTRQRSKHKRSEKRFHPLPARPLFPGVYSSFPSIAWAECLIFSHSICHNLVSQQEQGWECESKLHDCHRSDKASNCLDLWYGRANYECWEVTLQSRAHIGKF